MSTTAAAVPTTMSTTAVAVPTTMSTTAVATSEITDKRVSYSTL